MLSVKELETVNVDDEIDTGSFIFEGLPDEEFVHARVTRATGKIVECEITYFGIVLGHWVAAASGEKVIWVNQDASKKGLGK